GATTPRWTRRSGGRRPPSSEAASTSRSRSRGSEGRPVASRAAGLLSAIQPFFFSPWPPLAHSAHGVAITAWRTFWHSGQSAFLAPAPELQQYAWSATAFFSAQKAQCCFDSFAIDDVHSPQPPLAPAAAGSVQPGQAAVSLTFFAMATQL